MHAVDLGCERTWRKTTWRTTHRIPIDTPCLGVLCDGNISVPCLNRLERTIQELGWRVGQLGLGVLAIDPSTSLSSLNLPFYVTDIATDASEVLHWVCGVDVWLLANQSQLATSIEQLADYLKIPCIHFVLNQQESIDSAGEIAGRLTELFDLSRARLPMLAFRTAASRVSDRSTCSTTDAAIQILESALGCFKNQDRLPFPTTVNNATVRSAA